MLKHIKVFLSIILAIILLCACGSTETNRSDGDTTLVSETSASKSSSATKEKSKGKSNKVTMNISEFEDLQAQMPLSVISTNYYVQDEKYKTLYPDVLQAVIQNNTSSDIKDAVIAFVAWDSNNLPVKIKGSMDFKDGTYIKLVRFGDINLIPNSTYGKNSGYKIDEECNIDDFKAFVVSFETFDGDTWENPYFDEWRKLYEGQKYSNDLTVDVTIEEVIFEHSENTTNAVENKGNVTEEDIQKQVEKQELRVISTEYIVQDERYKALYPDMLSAVIKNNTDLDIKNAVVSFVAWDNNNLPVKIKGSIDFSDGAYVINCKFSDINLVPGDTFGEKAGMKIDETCKIATFKAIVKSYEAFDGTTWENPVFEDWCTLYAGEKLA